LAQETLNPDEIQYVDETQDLYETQYIDSDRGYVYLLEVLCVDNVIVCWLYM
jgi:hypothetical protein